MEANIWQQPGAEQASKSDTSSASESESEDKEEENEKDEMSASKKRRTRQKAHQENAYFMGHSPNFTHMGLTVPFAHRFFHKSPKELRVNVTGIVNKWKHKYYNMKGLSHKLEQYLQKGPRLERLRGIVEFEILGLFGKGVFEVIQNIHTPEGFNNMMSTPLWNGGTCLGEWKDDALPEFGPFETDENKEGVVFRDLHFTNFAHGFGLTC